jgi:hypothetical protein
LNGRCRPDAVDLLAVELDTSRAMAPNRSLAAIVSRKRGRGSSSLICSV